MELVSIIKVIIFFVFFLIKLISLRFEGQFIVWVLYIEWVVVWIAMIFISHRNKETSMLNYFSAHDILSILLFIKTSSWVWVSSICQQGWTRGFFIVISKDIGGDAANLYYLSIRIVEAFSFIPNATSMRYFSNVIRANPSQVVSLRDSYMLHMKKIGCVVALLAPFSMYVILSVMGKDVGTYQYFVLMCCGMLSVLRIALSREIVLKKVLHLSLVSYLSASASSLITYKVLSSHTLSAVFTSYLIFLIVGFLTPLLMGRGNFIEFKSSLYGRK